MINNKACVGSVRCVTEKGRNKERRRRKKGEGRGEKEEGRRKRGEEGRKNRSRKKIMTARRGQRKAVRDENK